MRTTKFDWVVTSLALSLAAPAGAVDCNHARPKQESTITIDAQHLLVPGPTTVESGATVHIQVNHKNLLDTVQFTLNRAAATPPENPLSDLLTLVTAQGVLGAGSAVASAAQASTTAAATPAAMAMAKTASPAADLGQKFRLLEERLKILAAKLTKLAEDYAKQIDHAGPPADCQGSSPVLTACIKAVKQEVEGIRTLVEQGIPTLEDETLAMKEIDELIVNRNLDTDSGTLDRRDKDAALIEALQFAVSKLKQAQTGLDKVATSLEGAAANASDHASTTLPADASIDTTVTVTISPSGAKAPITVLVHFQNWAWATMSAGVAFTSFKRYSYSVNPRYNAASSDPTMQTYYSIDQQISTRQIIPISYVNFQAPSFTWRWGGYDIGPTASVGAGVNVGTQSAEFAAGPGLRIGRVQFVVGAHWARSASLSNGFSVGQQVDSTVIAPVNNPYVCHWSVGITYRVR
jgi:hypothetical protein